MKKMIILALAVAGNTYGYNWAHKELERILNRDAAMELENSIYYRRYAQQIPLKEIPHEIKSAIDNMLICKENMKKYNSHNEPVGLIQNREKLRILQSRQRDYCKKFGHLARL